MTNSSRKTIFTTISIDKETAALAEKICKRYSLKKSEVVKLAFGYIDKAHINPSEAPESVKSELAKINKTSSVLSDQLLLYSDRKNLPHNLQSPAPPDGHNSAPESLHSFSSLTLKSLPVLSSFFSPHRLLCKCFLTGFTCCSL